MNPLTTRGRAAALLGVALVACAPGVDSWEERWRGLRDVRDLRVLTEARGRDQAEDGRTVAALRAEEDALRRRLADRAPRIATEEERRAWLVMRESLTAAGSRQESDDLRGRTYTAFGQAAERLQVGSETVDRLTVLGRLGRETDRDARRQLFYALAPVWQAVAGVGNTNPYRSLAAREADRWRPGHSPVERAAEALDFERRDLEATLLRVLERWRDTSAVAGEPWDYWYAGGEAARLLGARIPREKLRPLNDASYREVGADPAALGIAYDLEPRAGKSPVAFTLFAARWPQPRAAVFATYHEGGLDNLVELLHETGHAIHVSAVRTRPAYTDWPDSDTFTEALGDLLAMEAFEPAWQQRHLGLAASADVNRRSRYAAVMLDICWALLEWRVHREPSADPNVVWTELTSHYLKIAPHPEIAWWALRGQLVSEPGTMMDYALGSLLVANLRARKREIRGELNGPDPGLYAWLADQLYRFGRERPARQVVRDFLGRPLNADALLRDLTPPPASPRR